VQLPSAQEIARALGGDVDLLVKMAKELGTSLGGGDLTRSQIRNVFGMVKKLEMRGWCPATEANLKLLKPKLAYTAARSQATQGTRDLVKVLTRAIEEVTDANTFARFVDFFEAVLAYHRAAGRDR
jgi:CRISPR-associated protein Csm2